MKLNTALMFNSRFIKFLERPLVKRLLFLSLRVHFLLDCALPHSVLLSNDTTVFREADFLNGKTTKKSLFSVQTNDLAEPSLACWRQPLDSKRSFETAVNWFL